MEGGVPPGVPMQQMPASMPVQTGGPIPAPNPQQMPAPVPQPYMFVPAPMPGYMAPPMPHPMQAPTMVPAPMPMQAPMHMQAPTMVPAPMPASMPAPMPAPMQVPMQATAPVPMQASATAPVPTPMPMNACIGQESSSIPVAAAAAADAAAVAIEQAALVVEADSVSSANTGRSRKSLSKVPRWSPAEDERLKELVATHGTAWALIASQLEGGRSASAVEQHYQIITGKRRKSSSAAFGDDLPIDELAAAVAARAIAAGIAAYNSASPGHKNKKAQKEAERAQKEMEKAQKEAEKAQKEVEKQAERAEKLRKQAEKEAERAEKAEAKAAARAEKEAAKAEKAKVPKKPRSSYFFFVEEQRDQIKASNPDKDLMELTKLQGELWKALSDGDRQSYVEKAAADRVRYEQEMTEAGLPLETKEPKERAGRKRKSVDTIQWYVPEGFTIQEDAPSIEQLAFTAAESAAGDALVGRRLLFNWQGVGWCEGYVEERNRDVRRKVSGDPINFWVFYELDDNLSKHVLEAENYRFGPDAPEESWVLLSAIEGHPAAVRPPRKSEPEEEADADAEEAALQGEEGVADEEEGHKPSAAKKRRTSKQTKAAEEAEDVDKTESAAEKTGAALGIVSLPKEKERYFIPASLWPDEEPLKTAHGKGWLATVESVTSAPSAGKKRKSGGGGSSKSEDNMVVRFKCDGEDELIPMAAGAFCENCKLIGMAEEAGSASKAPPASKKEKKSAKARTEEAEEEGEQEESAGDKETSKAPAAGKKQKKAKHERAEKAEDEGGEKDAEDEAGAASDIVSLPKEKERYFIPASLWPDEEPLKTAHGKGWLATVESVTSAPSAGKKRKSGGGGSSKSEDNMVVRFKCDGEDELIPMAVGAFCENCKLIKKSK